MSAITLTSGHTMPILGLGTWKSAPGEVAAAVTDALEAGYRHIDCAFVYGNEKEVGEALAAAFAGGLRREDVFITSKLWNTFHEKSEVRPALMKTLKALQLDYLDLYLIHFPMGWQESGDDLFPEESSDAHYNDTWTEMERAVDDGLARSIGISNFNSQQVDDVLSVARIKPVMNQIEVHPWLNNSRLVEHCKSRGVDVTAYSPFASPDRPWATPGEPRLLDDPVLIEIGKKHSKSPAQVVLRWVIQRGLVVIPKSVNADRIKQNFDVMNFVLSSDDEKKIDGLDRNMRAVAIEQGSSHPHFPFNIPY